MKFRSGREETEHMVFCSGVAVGCLSGRSSVCSHRCGEASLREFWMRDESEKQSLPWADVLQQILNFPSWILFDFIFCVLKLWLRLSVFSTSSLSCVFFFFVNFRSFQPLLAFFFIILLSYIFPSSFSFFSLTFFLFPFLFLLWTRLSYLQLSSPLHLLPSPSCPLYLLHPAVWSGLPSWLTVQLSRLPDHR